MNDSVNPVEKMAADSTGKMSEVMSENAVSNDAIPNGHNSVNFGVEKSDLLAPDDALNPEDNAVKNETLEFYIEAPDMVDVSVEIPDVDQPGGQVETNNEGLVENFDAEVDQNKNDQPSVSVEEGSAVNQETQKGSYVYNYNIGQFIPSQTDLITENHEGPCKFGLIFPGTQNLRAPSIQVSNLMNRVYLRMNTTIVIKFTLDPTKAPTTDLYIRATPRFSSMDSMQFPVERCKVHSLEDDPKHRAHEFEQLCKCIYYNLAGHVVRSPTHGAIYCYDPMSRRHSVLSPLKSRSHDIVYSFHCKSSCPKGIDRRPLTIVFTLEQLNGLVLGQTSLNVKICSSPKRDRDRNERLCRMNASKKHKPSHEMIEAVDSDSDGHVQDLAATISAAVSKMKSDLNALSYHRQRADKLINCIAQTVKTLEANLNK